MLYPNINRETLTSIGQTSKYIDVISYNLALRAFNPSCFWYFKKQNNTKTRHKHASNATYITYFVFVSTILRSPKDIDSFGKYKQKNFDGRYELYELFQSFIFNFGMFC